MDAVVEGTTYHLENAASGRAKCKKCKEPIAKGELRIATNSIKPGNDFAFTAYHNVKCFQIPPRSMQGMSVDDFVDEHLVDRSNDLILSDPVKRQEIIDDIAYRPPKATKKKKGEMGDDNSDESSAIAKKLKEIKSVMMENDEDGDDDDDTERRAKKSKTTGDDSIETYAKAMKVYAKLKNDDLKSILRWNLGYGMTGTKDILLLRCIDGHVHGRLGRCPTCFQGKLQLKDEDAGVTVNCLGYYDEDLARRIPCGYAVANSSAPRLRPWYRDEPTEEELEAMKNVTEEHVAMANGKMSSVSTGGTVLVPPDLLSAVQEFDTDGRWDDADIKTKAQLLVDIGTATTTKLDYPQDEKKAMMSVGKMILQNQDTTAVEMIKLLMLEFGIATVKEEAKARQKSAMANSCVVPDNAGIIQVFQELGDYYFKEGNTNAGLTYKKAITAISSLDYAITSENAKGLGKGKTKLAGIGKGTADKIYEYYATGTIEKLVEKRAIHS